MPPLFFHTHARYKVVNYSPDNEPEDDTEWQGNEPRSYLPTFRQDYCWHALLDKILSS